MSKHQMNGKSALKVVQTKAATEAAVRGHGPSVGEELTDFSTQSTQPPAGAEDTDKHAAVDETVAADTVRAAAFDAKAPGLRAKLLEVAEEEIAKANSPGGNDGAMKCALGIENLDGVPTIVWHVGAVELRLSPVQAHDLGTDLLMMSREVQIPSRIAAALAEKNK